jgi:hypothetical protein
MKRDESREIRDESKKTRPFSLLGRTPSPE